MDLKCSSEDQTIFSPNTQNVDNNSFFLNIQKKISTNILPKTV